MTFLALVLAACGAAPNPAPTNEPATWQPEARAAAPAAANNAGANRVAANGAAPAPNAAASAGLAPQTPPAAQSTPPAVSASTPAAAANSTGVVIANVAGKPIDVSELLRQWMHHASKDALDEIDHLVLTHLVAAEAQRMGLVLPQADVEKHYTKAVADFEKDLQKRRPGITLDQYVDQVLGLAPYNYRERMRAAALDQLLAERVSRAFQLTNEHALIRVIIVKTEDALKQVKDALAAGEAFEEVAKRLSTDVSSKEGGRVAPVLRVDTMMGKLAFTTPIGGVSDPFYTQGAWLIVKVEARPKPLEGTTWSELQAPVEASLAARGIEEFEFTQWRGAMYQRYQVDLAPFLRLAGEPVR